jgi:hypothetical protein
MRTIEIPRAEWPAFFDSFSRQHEGWLANLEVIDSELGAQIEAEQLPLEGVTAELKAEGTDQISILLGRKAQDHVSHTVERAIQVMLEQNDAGADEALQIESSEGPKVLLRFRSPMPPELVDGIVLER